MRKISVLFLLLSIVVVAFAQSGQQAISVGSQSGNFNVPNQTRGYYFIAPCSFVLCGLKVENDTTLGFQHVAVVRFTNGIPPTWTSTTNDFDTLFYANNQPDSDTVACHINIFKGDIIGVYGCLATSSGTVMYNSVSSANFTTSVYGHSFNLIRSGMNFPLNTQQPHDLFKEPTFPIGRIAMFYNCCEPPRPDSISGPAHICVNDTAVFIADSVPNSSQFLWQIPAGFTLISGQGTDTIIVVANSQIQDSIKLKAINGCDTSVALSIPVSSMDIIPVITKNGDSLVSTVANSYQWYYNDTLIAGATNQWYVFTQNGDYKVVTDSGNCSDTSNIITITGLGINSLTQSKVEIYPQPAKGYVNINIPKYFINSKLEIISLQGKTIKETALKQGYNHILLNNIAQGYYSIHIKSEKTELIKKLIIYK